jgi:anti-sigma B factor antagonist
MDLNTKIIDNVIVVNLTGRLDIDLYSDIDKEINSIITAEADKHLLINFKDFYYINSAMIGIIIAANHLLEKSGRCLKLCNVNEDILRVFVILQLVELFEIYESEEEAIASF